MTEQSIPYRRLIRLILSAAFFLGMNSQLAKAQGDVKDILVFGEYSSEKSHQFSGENSKTINGGLNQPARILLPSQAQSFEGGKMSFKMSVDPVHQNYFTVKFWGSDRDKSMIMLFSEGKQVGYRHLGDIDYVWFGNGSPAFNNRFIYVTIPLPISQTKGKKSLDLELRSFGEIFPYGYTMATYQKNMVEPTLGFYRAYVHTSTLFEPSSKEVQGKAIVNPLLRSEPGEELISTIKERVEKSLISIIAAEKPVNQLEMMFLAPAYQIKWTTAYHNPKVIKKMIEGMDTHYIKYLNDPKLIYSDPNIYNGDWLTTGPIGRGIRQLWPQMEPILDQTFNDGKGNQVTHRKAWSELMEEAIKYGTTHRRQYSNQSMIIDLFIYDCNRALTLMNPSKALPEKQTMRYLYESLGLEPWLGRETATGPAKNLGDSYYELTSKGLTKELGFVGYYGEVMDWVVDIYKETGKDGIPGSGDPQIRKQLLKMAGARSPFRYPAVDNDGYKAMRAETVVGWRDPNHYPGDVIYGDRGVAWDASPLMTAAVTLDPQVVGIAQEMIADHQLFNILSEKLKLGGLRVTKSLLHMPDEYELIKAQKKQMVSLPMADNMPDFVFSDEEDGVVALKNGKDRLYASLYWRARNAINSLAKVHYITPTIDRLSNIYIHSEFEPSGMEYTRQNWVNLGFDGSREFYKGVESAHTGEKLPIAKIPEGTVYKPGEENVYAGRASFYTMVYGKYLIAMNTTKDKTFDLPIPASFRNATDLRTKKSIGKSTGLKVNPGSTVVLYSPTN